MARILSIPHMARTPSILRMAHKLVLAIPNIAHTLSIPHMAHTLSSLHTAHSFALSLYDNSLPLCPLSHSTHCLADFNKDRHNPSQPSFPLAYILPSRFPMYAHTRTYIDCVHGPKRRT